MRVYTFRKYRTELDKSIERFKYSQLYYIVSKVFAAFREDHRPHSELNCRITLKTTLNRSSLIKFYV